MIPKLFFHIRRLIRQQHLSEALEAARQFIDSQPLLAASAEPLNEIQSRLQLMTDALIHGYRDEHRNDIYRQLLQQLNTVVSDIALHWCRSYQPEIAGYWTRIKRFDNSVDAIRNTLEHFVAQKAVYQLRATIESGHQTDITSEEHTPREDLFTRHADYRSDLFRSLWLCEAWRKDKEEDFVELLTLPTIEAADICLIVSALTLSLLTVPDGRKVNALMNVYLKTTDQQVRQRALVGWLFALTQAHCDSEKHHFEDTLNAILNDENHVQQIVETQIQIFYCIHAEEDNQEIQRDIIPTLLRNSPITLQEGKLIEREDEDELNDILNPHDDEEAMEAVEQSMQKMIDMQQEGADVFFGGFARMKHFPFFHDIANWLMPFSYEHPALNPLMEKGEKRRQAIETMLQKGPFCDSDKYSFALVLQQTIDTIPDNILEVMTQGDMQMEGMIEPQNNNPAYVRRMYLQDLYRLFRLQTDRKLFDSPLSEKASHDTIKALIVNDTLAQYTSLLKHRMTNIIPLLYKRKHYHTIRHLIDRQRVEADSNTQTLYALSLQHVGQMTQSIGILNDVIAKQPQSIRAKSALARAYLADRQYANALPIYQQLHQQKNESIPYALRYVLCLVKEGKQQEALHIIYEQDYKYPDNSDVMRMLGWVQLNCDRLLQAQQTLTTLITHHKTTPIDNLYLAYTLWFQGNRKEAMPLLLQYAQSEGDCTAAAMRQRLNDAFNNDEQLFKQHHIDNIEQLLMIEQTLTDR